MAIQIIGESGELLEVENNDKNQARVSIVSRGNGFCLSGITGTMAAALAANATVFAMRYDLGTSARAYIDRIRFQFTTIAAFGTPVTAGRSIVLSRGVGTAATGGTGLPVIPKKQSSSTTSEFSVLDGGDCRISTTTGLTTTGITFEAEPLRIAALTHVGGAGAHYETIWEFNASESTPVVIEPGEVLAIRNGPNAMGAGGTWQLTVNVDWHEFTAF